MFWSQNRLKIIAHGANTWFQMKLIRKGTDIKIVESDCDTDPFTRWNCCKIPKLTLSGSRFLATLSHLNHYIVDRIRFISCENALDLNTSKIKPSFELLASHISKSSAGSKGGSQAPKEDISIYYFVSTLTIRFAYISWQVYQQDIIAKHFVDKNGKQLIIQVKE